MNAEAGLQHCDRLQLTKWRWWISCGAFLSLTRVRLAKDKREVPMAKIDLDSTWYRRTRQSAWARDRQAVRESRYAPRRARSGTGKADSIRQATSEESGKRTRAESEEGREGAEGIGRRGSVSKAAWSGGVAIRRADRGRRDDAHAARPAGRIDLAIRMAVL